MKAKQGTLCGNHQLAVANSDASQARKPRTAVVFFAPRAQRTASKKREKITYLYTWSLMDTAQNRNSIGSSVAQREAPFYQNLF